MLGRRIGSWILERELGRGGMGAVYEARHVSLQTHAAVKVLSAGLESEESFRQRFRREAELQAQLRHSNVARVLDYLEDGGQWFLVIEYLDRGSLADLLARGEKVSRQQAIAWTQQALSGLGHAHQKGIVHRDIKPANLMFSPTGEIVVMDFGIARTETAPGVTATGVTIGTPQYMSPEQIVTPNRVDGRADLYSLGVVLYELLAGRRPFDSGSEFAVLQAHVSEPPPPLRTIDPTIPPELEVVVMRALAKKPEDRYPDCDSMSRALDTAQPAAVPATIHHSVLYDRAAVLDTAGPSPGELRDRKRRAFQQRLAGGTVAVLALATFLAFRQGSSKSDESAPPPKPDTATTTVTVTAPKPDPPSPNPKPPAKTPPVQQTVMTPVIPEPQPVVPQPKEPPILPPAPPPLPEHPQIAIIGMGDDRLLAGTLEQEMERRFAGYRVVDERGDPDVDDLLRRDGANVAPRALSKRLLESGFHILILLRVTEGERREFAYRGQTGSIKASRVSLNAYLLPANRNLGTGWTELVEYTELSASAKAKQAFLGPTADLRQAIDNEWKQVR